jgi:hypothetical protein
VSESNTNPNEALAHKTPFEFSALQAEHQNGAVTRFGEYRPKENAMWLPRAGVSAQPLAYNPRKQRHFPRDSQKGE